MPENIDFIDIDQVAERMAEPGRFAVHSTDAANFGLFVYGLELQLATLYDVDTSLENPDHRLLNFASTATWNQLLGRYQKVQTSNPLELFATIDTEGDRSSTIDFLLPLTIAGKGRNAIHLYNEYSPRERQTKHRTQIVLGKTMLSSGEIRNPYLQISEPQNPSANSRISAHAIVKKAMHSGRLSGGSY